MFNFYFYCVTKSDTNRLRPDVYWTNESYLKKFEKDKIEFKVSLWSILKLVTYVLYLGLQKRTRSPGTLLSRVWPCRPIINGRRTSRATSRIVASTPTWHAPRHRRRRHCQTLAQWHGPVARGPAPIQMYQVHSQTGESGKESSPFARSDRDRVSLMSGCAKLYAVGNAMTCLFYLFVHDVNKRYNEFFIAIYM